MSSTDLGRLPFGSVGRTSGRRTFSSERINQAQATAALWDRLEIGEHVISLASGPFPVEPIRALDAIHLASARVAREVWPELVVLSLDARVRANAAAMGHVLLPATT